jgi:hypothetical protein
MDVLKHKHQHKSFNKTCSQQQSQSHVHQELLVEAEERIIEGATCRRDQRSVRSTELNQKCFFSMGGKLVYFSKTTAIKLSAAPGQGQIVAISPFSDGHLFLSLGS